MKDIAIYGCGGFGREVACVLNALNRQVPVWNIIGYFDDGVSPGTENRYGRTIGGIDTLNAYDTELAVVLAMADPFIMKKVYSSIVNPKISFPNIVAPTVTFYDRDSVHMGQGNIIIFGSRISCDVSFGDFNLLNSSCYIGHDVVLGNFNVLQPETRLSGGVSVGCCNVFGTRSTVLQYIAIGQQTRFGAGSCVIRKTTDNMLYTGNPAKKTEGF
jgi:sugar O-acyltransferase (sialic acid O-acetyltransferase NeuD family)